ncbi:piggyBac transposable element-derived protein 4-like [Clinocottus analis]|uniref:piggyBac transposable element-derived protein 4-like n=1 Tax=Clinocottus analis TaxID=304258 RepID=UPI0035C1E6D9
MTHDRYKTISWNLHLSDPDEDVHNEKKRGMDEHDDLFQLKPPMDTIKSACKASYQPRRNLAFAQRRVPSKTKTSMIQYMKDKYKMFALVDTRNSYRVDISIRADKSHIPSGHGPSYDIAMSLVQPGYLGTGYHVYMEALFTSSKLFMTLHECGLAACGAYSEHREGFPQTDVNALTNRSARGSIRWMRDGPIVYVKWVNDREISLCSTIHAAHPGKTVPVKQVGSRAPVPTPVAEYMKHTAKVELSDQIVQYFSAQHKTMSWYRNIF